MKQKFRAWDIHGQKMFTNDELIIWNSNVYANDSKKLTCNNKKGWSIDDEYLMQSTGLFDKNNKEIFEGDIVLVLDSLYTVFYDNEKGSYRLKPHDDRWNVDYMSNFSHGGNFEIIGNIYENPELLEVINEKRK
ncbi:TPA: hypothetical protein V0G91_001059 [Streptococcus pneumoniae]|nr:MAG TPA: YopX protein [Caudoviricetes sp.]HEW4705363.1 hypothetical protein [Streptococcus pneumoniae]